MDVVLPHSQMLPGARPLPHCDVPVASSCLAGAGRAGQDSSRDAINLVKLHRAGELTRLSQQIASWTGANCLVFGLGDQACSVFGQEQRLSHEALGRLLHGCHVDRLRRTAFLQRRTRVAGSLAFSLCRCKRNETPGQRTESVAKPAVQAQVPSRCRCRSELDIHRAHAADVALPSKSTARRCVSLTTGSPRRAGPPYGLPAQADTLRRVD
jgi:hypothetical protein